MWYILPTRRSVNENKVWFDFDDLCVLVISACGNNPSSMTQPSRLKVQTQLETVKDEPSKEATTEPAKEEPKEEPKEASNKPGEKFTLGDWEIVLDSFEFDQ